MSRRGTGAEKNWGIPNSGLSFCRETQFAGCLRLIVTAIIILIASIVCFTILFRLTIVSLSKSISRSVEQKHKAAEIIISTGKIPEMWIGEIGKRIRRLEKLANGAEDRVVEQKKAKMAAVKRLNILKKYFRKSKFVQDDEARSILVDKLEKVKVLWEQRSWEEIAPNRVK